MRRNWNALPGSWVSRTLFASLLFLAVSGLQAQDTVRVTGADTVAYEPDWRVGHSPGKAALYSALLPGAGQVYNRKWWKVPIAYAGLGISYYFIRENTREYQRYKTAYLATIDGDPSTVDEFDERNAPRSATCTAATDLSLAILTREAMQLIISEQPGVAARLLLAMAKRVADHLRETNRKLMTFAQVSKALQQELDAAHSVNRRLLSQEGPHGPLPSPFSGAV